MDNLEWTLLVPLLGAPFAGALICTIFKKRAADYAAVIFAGISLWYAITTTLTLRDGLAPERTARFLALPIDALSATLLLVVNTIGFALIIYSIGAIRQKGEPGAGPSDRGSYHAWLLISISLGTAASLAGNLLQLAIIVELLGIAAWALLSHTCKPRASAAGAKTLIISGMGTLLVAAALALLYLNIPLEPFSFDAISMLPTSLQATVYVLFIVALAAKIGLFPFYSWVLGTAAAAVTSAASICAGGLTIAAIYTFGRILIAAGGIDEVPLLIGETLASVTVLLALVMLLLERDLRRIAAIVVVINVGHIVAALLVGSQGLDMVFRSAVMHIIPHALSVTLLFMAVGIIARNTGAKCIDDISGAGWHMKFATIAFFTGAFTICGIPPFAGFWSKFYIVAGALGTGASGTEAALSMLFEAVIALGFFLWVGHKVFLGTPSENVVEAPATPLPMKIAISFLVILSIAAPTLISKFFEFMVVGM